MTSAHHRKPRLAKLFALLFIAAAGFFLLGGPTHLAQSAPEEGCGEDPPGGDGAGRPLGSLKRVPIPEPSNLSDFVRDRTAAIALGKALFWDMQVGGDGVQACASCHFNAGADSRSKNQVAPGGPDNPRLTFEAARPNAQLQATLFPFHKLSDPNNRHSQVLQSFDDIVSSQGVKLTDFLSAPPGAVADQGRSVSDSVFNVGGANVRRVPPRNSPTVINAVFNRRNLWDGSADNIFNGVNGFGVRDPNARVVRIDDSGPRAVKVRLENSSLASQAVGPPLNFTEMTFRGRTFPDIGRRLLTARPLAKQLVSPDDSVLRGLARTRHSNLPGLDGTYEELVRQAFQTRWWDSTHIVVVASNGAISFQPRPSRPLARNEYTVMEYNFSLFFGLAVQLYEATLVSDDAPLDRYFEGDSNALTAQQIRGMQLFVSSGKCINCHDGPQLTSVANPIFDRDGDGDVDGEIVERMIGGDCQVTLYDSGFYNIGVRPTEEDLGIGGRDPFGNPLAISDLLTTDPRQIPSQELLSIKYPNNLTSPPQIGERTSTQGAFKTSGLRNIALTAPYFHNGGTLTLRQVVQFYNRGGDFRERNIRFIDPDIRRLGLTSQQIDDIVAFLNALTDPRVERRSAPFDHPQIFLPNGHTGNEFQVTRIQDGTAQDQILEIPAVGRNGGTPLRRFLQ